MSMKSEEALIQPTDMGDWLTLADVSAALNIPVRTIYQWRYRGEGPPMYRFGGHVRTRRSDLHEWIEAHKDLSHGRTA